MGTIGRKTLLHELFIQSGCASMIACRKFERWEYTTPCIVDILQIDLSLRSFTEVSHPRTNTQFVKPRQKACEDNLAHPACVQ